MKRDIHQALVEWKGSSRRKPLILRGARQIGKTWSIQYFAKTHYRQFISIDFERNPEFRTIFDGDISSERILPSLELLTHRKISEEDTLLFFDEIQACPRAIMALRYFYEERPNLHVVAAGSFLEFALSEISFPVGRVQSLDMHPMTFLEFLQAKGMDSLAQELRQKPQAFPKAIHDKLLDELKIYFFVGGMPECVKSYINENSLISAFQVQAEIIHSYRQDFSKYRTSVDPTILSEVLHQSAIQVGEQIQYTKLNQHNSGTTNKKAFDSLCLARLTTKIPACHYGTIPLGAGLQSKSFKAQLVDIGLMQHLNHLPVEAEILHDNLLDIYRGKLAEQFVGQQLVTQVRDGLYYWKRDARGSCAEIDFMIQQGAQVIPIEVKSGASGSLRSLHLFLATFPQVPRGYVYSCAPYRELPEQKLTFLPLYYAGQNGYAPEL